MKKLVLLLIICVIAVPVFADIVKKPTITVLGGYGAQNVTLAGTTSKPTQIGASMTVEMPASNSLEYIFSGNINSVGGDYSASGSSATYSGSQYSIAAGIKMELQ